jgi:hypothetical protein
MPTFMVTLEPESDGGSTLIDDVPETERTVRALVEPTGQLRELFWVQHGDDWSARAIVETPTVLLMASVRSNIDDSKTLQVRDILRLWTGSEMTHQHGAADSA